MAGSEGQAGIGIAAVAVPCSEAGLKVALAKHGDGFCAPCCLVDQAKQWNADLIVMGTHGRRGLRRLALGSDAELVVRSASVPVLLVRGDAGHE